MEKKEFRKWMVIGAGCVFFAIITLLSEQHIIGFEVEFALFMIPYFMLGFPVLKNMSEQLGQGEIINENIFIVLATAGAMGIGKYIEANLMILLFGIAQLAEAQVTSWSKKRFQEFVDVRPRRAVRLVKGREFEIDADKLKPGNVIVVKPSELVPVDGVVIEGETTLDMKALTGETIPQTAVCGDRIYSGTINLTGVIHLKVVRSYENSAVAKVIRLVEDAANSNKGKHTKARRITRIYTIFMLMIAACVIFIPPNTFAYGQWREWVYKGMILLVAACPAGVLFSEPVTYLGGILAAARRGAVVKGGQFLEQLNKADVYVFDKTGTLTKGEFEVTRIHAIGMEPEQLLKYAAYAESYSRHPVAKALTEKYGMPVDKSKVKDFREVAGYGVIASVDGRQIHLGNRRMADRCHVSYDVVKNSGSVIYVVIDGTYAGYITVEDKIKEEAANVMQWLRKKKNAILVMLTGDKADVAKRVATELEMDYVYAGLLPKNKMDCLDDFMGVQREHEKVVFVGDGMNDAMALRKADIGIAMGVLGTDAAVEAADIILLEDDLNCLIDVATVAGEAKECITLNLTVAFIVKTLILLLTLLEVMTLWTVFVADLVVMLMVLINAVSIIFYPVD